MSAFVQLRNPASGRWVRVSRRTGRIVGRRSQRYKCPIYRSK